MKKSNSINFYHIIYLFLICYSTSSIVLSQTLSEMEEKSELLIDSGKGYEEAFAYFSNILQNNPNNEFCYYAQYQLGRIYYRKGDFQKARAEFQKVIDKYPDSEKVGSARWVIGYTYQKEGDSDKALQAFEDFVKRHPDHKMVQDAKERIAVLIGIKKNGKNIEEYKSLLGVQDMIKDDKSAELCIDSGLDYEKAEAYFKGILEQNPPDERKAYALYQLGRIKYKDEFYKEARDYFQKIVENHPNTERAASSSWMIGYTYLQKKDYNNSLNAFQYYVDKYPNDKMVKDAKERIAAIKHINRDLFSSIEAYKEILAEAETPQDKAKAQVEIAGLTFEIAKGEDINYRPEDSQEYLEWLNKAREECMKVFDYEASRQSKAVAELMYFETYLNEREPDKCIELGKKFLNDYPDQKREYYMGKYTLGLAYLDVGGEENVKEAMKYFDEILAANVKEEECFKDANIQARAAFAKAQYYEEIGDVGKAKELYRFIKEKYPKTRESLSSTFNLGELIKKYGE